MKRTNGTIKVIIAEDNPACIEGLQMLLINTPGYEIIYIARDGEELVNCPVLYKADIVLSDIEMPKMNGIEAAKRINFNFSHLKLIALTMYADKVYLNDIIEAGFKAFIHKPELFEKLEITIEKVLDDEYHYPNDLKINNKQFFYGDF